MFVFNQIMLFHSLIYSFQKNNVITIIIIIIIIIIKYF